MVNALDERHWCDGNLCRKLKVCVWQKVRLFIGQRKLRGMSMGCEARNFG